MKKLLRNLFRKLAHALYIRAYDDFPHIYAFWNPQGKETMPPKIGLSFNGKPGWYRIESGWDK